MEVRAIFLDTRSIQRYIFSGNKLKTNIGASYIVDHIFDKVLLEDVIQPGKFGLQTVDKESWKKSKGTITQLPADCYTAYIGGGNVLLLFRNEIPDHRKEIITEFTTVLLERYPGLHTGAAMGMIQLDTAEDPEAFFHSRKVLYTQLKQHQNTIFPLVNVPYTGLTLACEVNGEAANFYDEKHEILSGVGNEHRFFSQEVMAKVREAKKANEELKEKFEPVIRGFEFPTELDHLGQKETENYIAVVHIDGNNMGNHFRSCKTLAAISQLSYQVSEKTKKSFGELLQGICDEYDQYKSFLDKDQQHAYLPIRPLILGGDDVTFVCAGKLALEYAVRFMQLMMKDEHSLRIDCCAGIAIQPTSYPFFRGYELAEQACGEAKARSRKIDGSSWLDFVILHGEQAPTIAQIRAQEYKGALGKLHFGPYRVDGDTDYRFHIQKLFDGVQAMRKLPRNKVKELRNVLQHGEHDARKFIEQLHHNHQNLPNVQGWEAYAEHLWQKNPQGENGTPYVDVIEMMDYISPLKEVD